MIMRPTGLVLLPLIVVMFYVPQVRAAPAGLALDGYATSVDVNEEPCFPCLPTHNRSAYLTTTHANDVIVVVAQCGFSRDCSGCADINCDVNSTVDNITSVTDDGGHAWSLRVEYKPQSSRPIWEYYTIARDPLSSDKISVTWSGYRGVVGFVAFGVSGANIQHPWDPSRNLPVIATGPSVTLSVAGAQDFLIVSTAINDDQNCQNITPFQNIANYVYAQAETDYYVTPIGGSNTATFVCNDSSPWVLLGDALQGPPGHGGR